MDAADFKKYENTDRGGYFSNLIFNYFYLYNYKTVCKKAFW